MVVPKSNLTESLVEEVRRIEVVRKRIERRTPTKITNELLVVFKAYSFASNLAKTSSQGTGIRMEIPAHLQGVFRTLDNHGHLLKERHGPGFKRSIHFDDLDMSLYMDIKIPNQDRWLRVDYEAARDELKFVNKQGLGTTKDGIYKPGATQHTEQPGPSRPISVPLPESTTLQNYGKPWGMGQK